MSAAMLRIGASKAKCQSSGLGLIILATCLSMGHARTAYTCKVYSDDGCTVLLSRDGAPMKMGSNPYGAKSAKFLCDLTLEVFGSTDCSGTSGIL
ncbi:unnamed protein product [Polarella glacialis]|uniref:Uncharacterized protein n=1 Tax=Polarella glacialis TaxID=89957 RepID=A0A813DJJ2_POLGL|nr:unnamed protein product [Polarella glacialis]